MNDSSATVEDAQDAEIDPTMWHRGIGLNSPVSEMLSGCQGRQS